MMPKILQLLGKISVYMYRENSHARMHVHIYQGDPKRPERSAVITLGDWVVIENNGFKLSRLEQICELLVTREDELAALWKELNDEN